ncbi:hypothetical protein TNCT_703581 [Trichonephila clavata]|uniref:Uncharacterized protein n=1 Tax=Trichonephila clavata TaxID=2740835 RepID=A0A8X6F218_TRICU|nr:hypothetical protein TNCT_703581 [Trichonephila clavata]
MMINLEGPTEHIIETLYPMQPIVFGKPARRGGILISKMHCYHSPRYKQLCKDKKDVIDCVTPEVREIIVQTQQIICR